MVKRRAAADRSALRADTSGPEDERELLLFRELEVKRTDIVAS